MRAGIDLGGTKIELVLLDERDRMVYRERLATPQGQYDATVEAMVALVHDAEKATGPIASLGVGIPGAISKQTGRIKNANSICLIDQDLSGDLSAKLNRPVTLANDANCFALSEAKDGAGKDADSVFGVIIGTGCGGGLVVDGKIVNGVNSIAGEWGHNPLPWLERDEKTFPCYCGLTGCTETFLSGSGFEQHYLWRTGQKLSAQEIVAKVDQDSQAEQLLADYAIWLAKGLASVINIFDPDVIVLGGGMSNIDSLYEIVPSIWHQWVFSDRVDTKLLPPKWGDSSGVRGAAWL